MQYISVTPRVDRHCKEADVITEWSKSW